MDAVLDEAEKEWSGSSRCLRSLRDADRTRLGFRIFETRAPVKNSATRADRAGSFVACGPPLERVRNP
jgi:hypothetical protein